MTNTLLLIAIGLLGVALGMLFMLLTRSSAEGVTQLRLSLELLAKGQERAERAVREEIARNREESLQAARQSREELGAAFKNFGDSLHKQLADLTLSNEQKLEKVRETVDGRLRQLQEDNTCKLDQMRQTVDEKLSGTLERRLGESFKLVCDRLEQVHKGLGEMQTLANGVGDLKRVLTNVKTRGTWGEIQLGAILEQIMTPDQYALNVMTREGSGELVEFAIKLPGRNEHKEDVVWLPIDAKFPQEDYQRLLDAQERADAGQAEVAIRQLEIRIKGCAKDICAKYLNPPKTTDFGIMYLPTEGLYAEVVRRVGLIDIIQRECRVIVAGPTTLAALLNSLQMGFRTLAIEQRSSEVWKLLGAVKNEFGKFTEILDGVHRKLQTASNTIEDATRKTRTIERKLRSVQEMPAPEAQALLGALGDGEFDSL